MRYKNHYASHLEMGQECLFLQSTECKYPLLILWVCLRGSCTVSPIFSYPSTIHKLHLPSYSKDHTNVLYQLELSMRVALNLVSIYLAKDVSTREKQYSGIHGSFSNTLRVHTFWFPIWFWVFDLWSSIAFCLWSWFWLNTVGPLVYPNYSSGFLVWRWKSVCVCWTSSGCKALISHIGAVWFEICFLRIGTKIHFLLLDLEFYGISSFQ